MRRGLIISFLSLIFFAEIGFAESPGIKITQPLNGATVTPGQEIAVTVESVGGFVLKEGFVGIAKFPPDKEITVLPDRLTLTIPNQAVGKVVILAFGYGVSGKIVSDKVTLNVQQTATLQSLEINQNEIFVNLDWDGNIKGDRSGNIVTVYGIFSDGVKRELDNDPATTYTSSDPSIISIDNTGKFQVYKVGAAAITVSNAGISKILPVVFRKPRGIRPSELIPPTTKIDIQPQPNPAGWNNTDITITLTAQDNEGGSGIRELYYSFLGTNIQNKYVESDSTQIPFSYEGIKELVYKAIDKEGNYEKVNLIELRLDKTPPVITAAVLPQPNAYGWNNSDATVTFNAADKLSGVKSVSRPVTVTRERAKHTIRGEAIDLADNKATTAVSVNIDKTPPELSISAIPNILPPNNKMVNVIIHGKAIDNLSGIDRDSLTFKVIDEYGKVQPLIAGFGSSIKLEASIDAKDKDGRTYTISVTAKDKAGNESVASAIVTVPRDMGRKNKTI